jgi:O-antigen/teichoic acid export membrane protein
MRRRLPELICLFVLLVLPLMMFWQQTVGGRTLIPAENLYQYEPYATYGEVVKAPAVPHNHLVSDLILENYIWKQFARQQLAQGEVPLWNPHQFAGIPFLAAGQHSALYPVSVLYYTLDLPAAYGWYTVVNLWLAGVMMLGFVRALGLSYAGAMLAAIVYQLCGFVLASVVFQMMIGGFVWLPLMLWMIEWIIQREAHTRLAIIVGAVALGLNILAGHAEITIYTLFISGYYAAFRLGGAVWPQRRWRWGLVRGLALLVMIALGLGLGAVQLVPLFEFVQTNWRAERASLELVRSYAHPLRDVVQFVMPNFYGSPAHHHIYDLLTMQMVTLDGGPSAAGTPVFHTEWGIKNYVEGALYLGILPLVLACFGLVYAWRSGQRIISAALGSLGILSLTFMFGLPTYALIYALPGINQLNSPFRWIYALTVCVAVLAAFGLDAVSGRGGRGAVTAGRGMMVVGLLIMAALVLSRVFYEQVAPLVEQAFNGLAGAASAFPNADLFYSYQVFNAGLLAAMLAAGGWLLLRLARQARGGGSPVTGWEVVTLAVVSVDLMLATWAFNPASDPELLKFTPPVVQAMQADMAQHGRMRFTTLDEPAQRTLMNANAGWLYGLDDVRGYDSIIPRPYVEYMRGLAPQIQLDFNRIAPLYTEYGDGFPVADALASDRLRWLNVGYIITHAVGPGYQRLLNEPFAYAAIFRDSATALFRVTNSLPRAYLCCTDPALTRLFDDGQPLPEGTYAAVYADVTRAAAPVTIAADTGREKRLTFSAPGDRWLVVSENHAAGWRAFIRPATAAEDQEALLNVQPVNGIFQGVRVPAGDWVVRLVYSPASFQIGLFGSLVSGALIMLLLGISLWRTFVGANTPESSTGARVARNSVAPIILNLFNKGVDFAFLLVMLRLLTPEDVGTYYYLVVIFVWFDIFSNFGLDLFLIREVSRDKSSGGLLLFNTAYLRLALTLAGIGLAAGFVVARQLTVDPPLSATTLLTLALLYVGLFPASLSKGMSSLFYAHEEAEKPAAIATITTINKAVFGMVVLVLGWGIVGLALVSIVNNLVTLVVLLTTGRRLIGPVSTFRPQTALIRRMLRESWPLLLNHFLATIFFQIDVIILEAYRGAEIVAKYSVSYRWLNAINIIPSFFTQALLPVMARQSREDREALRRTYCFGIKLLFTLAMPTAVIFTFLAEPLTTLMGGQQYLPEGAVALVLMIWSIPIGWMNSLTQYALIALDMQTQITRAFFAAVLFNIVTNMLFIPQYGFVAAALTTIASELVLFIPWGLMMQRGLGARLPWMGLLWKPAAAAGVMTLAALAAPGGLLPGLIIGCAAYGVSLLALHPLDSNEQRLLGRMLPARLMPWARRLRLAA